MGFGLRLPTYGLSSTDVKNYENSFSSIWGSIKNIWSQLNVEIKHNDESTFTTAMSLTPQLYGFSDIAIGITGSSDASIDKGYRDGDKIRCKTLNIKGLIAAGTAATTTRCHILVFKHYANFLGDTLNAPKMNEIYDQYTGDSFFTRLRNNDHVKTYKVLARRSFTISGLEDKNNEKMFNIFIPFKRRAGSYVEWEGGSSTSPSNGRIYMFAWTENATNGPTISWSSRLTYIDN